LSAEGALCLQFPLMFCVERQSGYAGCLEVRTQWQPIKRGVYKAGKVKGQLVADILLDTEPWCATIILVPASSRLEGDVVAICCAHGDTVLYPLARGCTLEVEAAVSGTSPMSMLLAQPLKELLATNFCESHCMLLLLLPGPIRRGGVCPPSEGRGV
jgi:hypothetical protein